MDEDGTYSYIARATCGCLTMATIDNPNHRREVAKEVADAIRCGNVVERVTTESVRKMDWKCPKHRLEEELDEVTNG